MEEIDKNSYQVISLSYIENNINDLKNNDNKKIRIVNNEGSIVRTTGTILNSLNEILGNYYTGLIDNKLIKKYNKDYNKYISINDNNLEIFNKSLNIEDIDNIKYHIAKHLYFVFDYKKLENKVFIKINDDHKDDYETILKVYEKAKSNDSCFYTFLDGKSYREKSILDAKNKNKYGKKVVFRKNIIDINNDEEEKKIIANHIINLVWLISMTYSNFIDINIEIINEFSKLIAINYNISHDLFYNKYIKPKIDNIDIFISKDNNTIETEYSYNIDDEILKFQGSENPNH